MIDPAQVLLVQELPLLFRLLEGDVSGYAVRLSLWSREDLEGLLAQVKTFQSGVSQGIDNAALESMSDPNVVTAARLEMQTELATFCAFVEALAEDSIRALAEKESVCDPKK